MKTVKNYPKTFYIVPEIALDRMCGYFKVKCLGLEFGLCWPSRYGEWSIDIGIYGYGLNTSIRPFHLWFSHECYNDFWATRLKEIH